MKPRSHEDKQNERHLLDVFTQGVNQLINKGRNPYVRGTEEHQAFKDGVETLNAVLLADKLEDMK